MTKIKGTFIVRNPGHGDAFQKRVNSKTTVEVVNKTSPDRNGGNKSAVKGR